MVSRAGTQGAFGPDGRGDLPRVQSQLVDLGFPCHLACPRCDRTAERARAYHLARRRIRAFLRARRAEVLRLVFFGGDPFALPRSFAELLSEMAEEAEAQGMGLEGVALSDGTSWNLDVVRRFASLGVTSYHVAVDGPRAVHDRERPTRAGGSFDRIMNSLLWHRDGAQVEVRVNGALDERELDALLDVFRREDLLAGPNPVALTVGPRRTCRKRAAELVASCPSEQR